MKYKMAVFDCDGTLLNDEQRVTERTKKAIKDLSCEMVEIVFASGRTPAGVRKVALLLNMEKYIDCYVCYNGAYAINTRTRENMVRYTLSKEDFGEIYSLVKNSEFVCYVLDENGLYANKKSDFAELEANKNDVFVRIQETLSIPENTNIYKVVIAGEKEKLDQFEKKISPVYREKYNIVRSEKCNLEFMHKGACKGDALEIIAEKKGISRKEIIVFGDAENDISMFQVAGLSVAMGNASEAVKRTADRVTTSNNSDGIAIVLEEEILRK